mmetsp:Transcript_22775/g.40377  ORF Transcript_22775/g.40377 Transcript_22775/m.40377 type:complete len:92 (+) Transcript_22775:1569-1844(+)
MLLICTNIHTKVWWSQNCIAKQHYASSTVWAERKDYTAHLQLEAQESNMSEPCWALIPDYTQKYCGTDSLCIRPSALKVLSKRVLSTISPY